MLIRSPLHILRSSATVWGESEERELSEEESSLQFKLLILQENLEVAYNRKRHRDGVAQAKQEGKYVGRKKNLVDPNLLRQIAADFYCRKVTESEAMHRSKITSRSNWGSI